MRNRLGVGFAIVSVLAFAFDAVGQIPKLAEIPASIPSSTSALLSQERAELITQRDQLQADAKSHNGKCKDVPTGSPLAAECDREQRRLEVQRDTYIKAAQAFNRRLTNSLEQTRACADFEIQLAKDREALRRQFQANQRAYEELEQWENANQQAAAEALSIGVKALGGPIAEKLQEQSRSAASYLAWMTRYEKAMKDRGIPYDFLAEKIQRSARSYLNASIAAKSGTLLEAGLLAEESWEAMKKGIGAVANVQTNANASVLEVVNDPDLKKIIDTDEAGREATKALVGLAVQSDELKKFAPTISLASFAFDYGYEAKKWAESRKRILQQSNLSEQNLKAVETLRGQIESTAKKLRDCRNRPSV